MNLTSVKDLELLPSVLSGEETSSRMIELVELARIKQITKDSASEAINYLISYLGEGHTLNELASLAVLNWTKEVYDQEDRNFVYWTTGNLANLTCEAVNDFIKERLSESTNAFEIQEYRDTAHELGIET